MLKTGDHAIHGPKFEIENINQIESYFSEPSFINSFNIWYDKVMQLYNFTNRLV